MSDAFAATPKSPYYIVAFSSIRADGDHGYSAMADAEIAGLRFRQRLHGIGDRKSVV